jgi:hypothetical protein
VTDPTYPPVADAPPREPAPVAADVPADEPLGTPPAAPEQPAPEPPATEQPVTPEPVAPPLAPATPEPPPVEPPAEPVAPTAPEPITPSAPDPVPVPPTEPVAPEEPAAQTTTLDAGLAAAAATTTEVAPPATVPSPTPEPVAADPVRRARRRGMLLGLVSAGVLALLVAAALTATGPIAAERREDRADDRRAAAVRQAGQLALNLVSINYQTLDEDLKRISESTTGKARAEFDEKILENESYKDLVVDNQAVITSKIQRIGIEPCGTDDAACKRGDTATVLVFLDQESKNKLRTTPRVDRNRVLLTLVRHGEKWLVSEVKVL